MAPAWRRFISTKWGRSTRSSISSASVAGLHELGIEKLYASAVPLGHGWIESAHGRLPLPAPATLELLAAAGAPTRPAPGPGELLTPTAAAILAELASFEQPLMTLSRIGVGAGQKEFAWPNVARLWLGQPAGTGSMVQLETNIDDMNPQLIAAVSEKLLARRLRCLAYAGADEEGAAGRGPQRAGPGRG